MADYIECNSDFHIHGLYSQAVSKDMIPNKIAEQAPLKGLDLVATGDILNPKWLKLIKEQLKPFNASILQHENGTKFILQAEINDMNRVHHIILFPSISKVEEIREAFKSKSRDMDIDGRPTIRMNGEEIADLCTKADCMIGFSHAFTPYFGIFSKYNSYKQCYGSHWNKIYFMELGLSADTNMADKISELHNLTFTSNSDSHSPWPNKMGREFNRLQLKEINFEEVKKAFKRENGRGCILNIKFNPLEGKYHKTRCTGCLIFYEPADAIRLKWRCPNCNKPIKKGVDYRIHELADLPENVHPDYRPKCIHIIPLSEIIALALNISNAWSNRVQTAWKEFINEFGNEINVLLNVPLEELSRINKTVSEYVGLFRENKIQYVPGGAGVYGKLLKPGAKINEVKKEQKSLDDF